MSRKSSSFDVAAVVDDRDVDPFRGHPCQLLGGVPRLGAHRCRPHRSVDRRAVDPTELEAGQVGDRHGATPSASSAALDHVAHVDSDADLLVDPRHIESATGDVHPFGAGGTQPRCSRFGLLAVQGVGGAQARQLQCRWIGTRRPRPARVTIPPAANKFLANVARAVKAAGGPERGQEDRRACSRRCRMGVGPAALGLEALAQAVQAERLERGRAGGVAGAQWWRWWVVDVRELAEARERTGACVDLALAAPTSVIEPFVDHARLDGGDDPAL